jgi:hypothetical protein
MCKNSARVDKTKKSRMQSLSSLAAECNGFVAQLQNAMGLVAQLQNAMGFVALLQSAMGIVAQLQSAMGVVAQLQNAMGIVLSVMFWLKLFLAQQGQQGRQVLQGQQWSGLSEARHIHGMASRPSPRTGGFQAATPGSSGGTSHWFQGDQTSTTSLLPLPSSLSPSSPSCLACLPGWPAWPACLPAWPAWPAWPA